MRAVRVTLSVRGRVDLFVQEDDRLVERLLQRLLPPGHERRGRRVGEGRGSLRVGAHGGDADDVGVGVGLGRDVRHQARRQIVPGELLPGGRHDLRSHRETGQRLQLALVGLREVDRRADGDADGGGLRLSHDPCGRRVQRRLEQADDHHDGGDHDDRLDDQPFAPPEDLGVGAQARGRLALIGQGGRLSLVAGASRRVYSRAFVGSGAAALACHGSKKCSHHRQQRR